MRIHKRTILLLGMLAGAAVSLARQEKVPKDKKKMRRLYGENKEITGSYDVSSAARCNNGTFVGLERDGVISYKGIPYAAAPTGALRWKPPVPAPDNGGVYQARYFGRSPIQTEWPSEVGSYYPQSEDCLTLNVWTSAGPRSEKKAVMVFFHGGSYGWGGTSDPMYDGHNFVSAHGDIVLVTAEYRTGIMGFIDFSAVEGGEEYKESGNLGLLDMKCSLEWVKKNIAAFGGDPDNVTIFGESAGAGGVSLLPLMNGTKGLFRRVIAESGSIALTYSREECRRLTRMLLNETNCRNMKELLSLSEAELMKANEKLNDCNNFPERDGTVLPEDLYAAYERGDAAHVDMLIGTNKDETRYWINEMGFYTGGVVSGELVYSVGIPIMYENYLLKMSEEDKKSARKFIKLQKSGFVWSAAEFGNELLFRIPALKQAELQSKNGANAYVYYFTYPSALGKLGACHASELMYVFNNPQVTIYNGDNFDRRLAGTIQQMWVGFAKTGDPGTPARKWEKYDPVSRMTMVIGADTHMESDLLSQQRRLTEPLLKYHFNGCYTDLSLNVPCVYKAAGTAAGGLAALTAGAVLLRKALGKGKRKNK